MKVFGNIIQVQRAVLALGFFDGVHKGHQEIIKKMVECAGFYNVPSVLITFKHSPAEAFCDDVKYITDNKQKECIISGFGVDYMLELDFNETLMNMTHCQYLENILYKNLHPSVIITGFNHTFGKDKMGTPEFLRQNEDKYGYKYIETGAVMIGGKPVSSTLIKESLSRGDIKNAVNMLGREFEISGTVIEGNHIGRTIGFPTANIRYPENIVEIPYGVYVCNVLTGNQLYKGVLNYGLKPTINEQIKIPVAEVHIIGFNKDIYGEEIKVYLKDKIRDEIKFHSLDELRNQINEDMKKC